MPSAMSRPPLSDPALPWIEGGGATTVGPPFPSAGWEPALPVYCSATGNSGAGATTSEWPMLSSTNLRAEAASTCGVGATTACDKAGACWPLAGMVSGGGATTDADRLGSLRLAAVLV